MSNGKTRTAVAPERIFFTQRQYGIKANFTLLVYMAQTSVYAGSKSQHVFNKSILSSH